MPAFNIDLGAKDAPLQLDAIMCWSHDAIARQNYLVTVAAQVMQDAEDLLPRAAEEAVEILMRQAHAAGVTIDPARLKAQALVRGVAAVSNVQAEINNDIFRPSGGFGRVAAAGGLDAILHEAEATAGGKYGRACGEILGYIVMMDRHHRPELRPSVRRATHIMVERAKFENRSIPDDHDRKEMWGEWGGAAPLWAARTLAAPRPGIHHVPVKRIIQYAHWLANFAVDFRPERSPTGWRLLTEAEVIRINPELPPLKPPIPPLPAQLLSWARSYKG